MKKAPTSPLPLVAMLLLLASVTLSSALDVTARYFRFTQTKLRDDLSANSIQLSEFDMLFHGARLPGATASNPGGDTPAGEVASFAVDGSTATKWLDFLKLSLVLDYGAAVTADGYRFATANDSTERDPVSWVIESSDDAVTWNVVETKSDYPTPSARFTYTPDILFLAPIPLTIVNFTTTRPKIGIGESATLTWNVVGSTSVTIDQSVGAVAESGTTTVTPAAETIYTLTATKGAETVTAQATVKPIVTGPHTFQFFRFNPLTLRGASASSIQISEFEMLNAGVPLTGATATNPAGLNNPGETATEAVDGNTATKWLDFNKSALVLDFGTPVQANSYRFATANDFDERDPVSWTLEGSNDNVTWVPLDAVTNFPTPVTRLNYIGTVPLPAVVLPTATFSAAPVHLQAGESTTLTWNTDDADAVLITPSVPNGNTPSNSAVVTPAGPTDYTLTATNSAGTTTRTARVQVEGPVRQVTWKFFRFNPTALRNDGAANSVQIAEFELSLAGQRLTGATASNPGGDSPAGEAPAFAVDGDTATKWLDFNKTALVLEYPAPVTIDGYRIATASDATERDPVGWTLEGSSDGVTWSLIDSRNIGFVIPEDRFTYTSYFRFDGTVPPAEKILVPITLVNYNATAATITLTWSSEVGRTYLIERSTDLAAWTTAVDNIASGGATTTQVVPATGTRLFLQVVQKP